MDIAKLINEIVRKVELAIIEYFSERAPKQKVLIISKDLDQSCPKLLADENVKERCAIDCADNSSQQVNLEGYSKVIVCDLDNDSLSKLTLGIFDNPYLKLIGSCIMQGKNIAVVEDDIEFLKYQDTAPAAFLQMFNSKLDTLREWGIDICSLDDLTLAICGADEDGEQSDAALQPQTSQDSVSSITVTKKALTEDDVIDAFTNHQNEIHISQSTLVTEIASEYAEKHHISIVRL